MRQSTTRMIDRDGEAAEHPGIAGLRLLLVEDDYLLAQFLTEILELMGAHVIGPVASVDDALDVIERCPDIDAAILDVNLRGEPVYPVADLLGHRDVPFVFASGYGPESIPSRYRDARLCTKPVNPDALLVALERLCPRPRSALH